MSCECSNVKLYEGKWMCMICRRRFIPIDICGKCKHTQVEEQKPVRDWYEPKGQCNG